MKARAAETGFTLVESLLSIVIIGIALSGLIAAWSHSVSRSSDPYAQVKMMAIAQLYRAQMAPLAYDEKDSCNAATWNCSSVMGNEGERRSQFDDIDDFNALNEAVESIAGESKSDYRGYQVAISVSYAGGDFALAPQALKKVSLKVSDSNGQSQLFTYYRGVAQ